MSIWQTTARPSLQFDTLRENLKTDVLIIGGGISGLTTALRLLQSGRQVTLIESGRLGMGTTGNSTGNLYSVVDRHLWSLQTKWNPDVLRTVVSSRSHAINFIEDVVHEYGIDCDFQRCDFNYYVEKESEATSEFLKKQFYAAVVAQMETLFKTRLPLPFFANGLTIPNQAQFHPLKYIYGLTDYIHREYGSRCQIFEETPAIEIDGEFGMVKTARAVIQAEVVVMATHTPKGVHWIQNHLHVVREHGIAVETESELIPPGIFWGVDEPKHSIRSLKTNGKNYLIAVGDAYKTGHPGSQEALNHLKSYVRERFQINEPFQFWAGQAYRSADGLPYIGRHDERLYLMTGFSTDGLVYGTLAGIIVDDLIHGVNNVWERTYALKRFTPLKSAKEMIHEGADNLKNYLKDDFPKPTHVVLDEIPVGEGRVVEGNRDKLAVYRASETQFEVCSAVCTHLKCIVAWNSLEKSWDCPCHGSRFTTEGKVIEGPALENLEKKMASDLQFPSGKPLNKKNGVPYAPEVKDQTR